MSLFVIDADDDEITDAIEYLQDVADAELDWLTNPIKVHKKQNKSNKKKNTCSLSNHYFVFVLLVSYPNSLSEGSQLSYRRPPRKVSDKNTKTESQKNVNVFIVIEVSSFSCKSIV